MSKDLREIFDSRAESLNDHDPWRYGSVLSKKTDLIELSWVKDNFISHGSLLDLGCGTGRHVIELAKENSRMNFLATDFAPNNVRVARKLVEESGVTNITTSVMDAKKVSTIKEEYENILCIGLTQYIFDDYELESFFKDCSRITTPGGLMIMKNPITWGDSYISRKYSPLLKSDYASKYRSCDDVIRAFSKYYELMKIERVFTSRDLTEIELEQVEDSPDKKQMWFLLRSKNI